MPTPPEVAPQRWAWSESAMSELRARLGGLADAPEHAHMAHIMVVGRTQVGKTTLIMRLLGVRDGPEAHAALDALRGGRGPGESATAIPVRYRWSGRAREWLLSRGGGQPDEWLTTEDLRATLAGLRAGGAIRWSPGDRPWEIGVPDELAGTGKRENLRVFDLPGVGAEGRAERRLARDLIAEYAPVMALVLFVATVDQFSALSGDADVTSHPFFTGWHTDPEHYRVVLTCAYSDQSLRDALTGITERTELRELVLTTLHTQVEDTLGLSVARGMIHPVEVGTSWRNLRGANYIAAVGPVNDGFIESLAVVAKNASVADAQHLMATDVVRRVEASVAADRERRQVAAAAALALLDAARAEAERARALALAADNAFQQLEGDRDHVREGLAELSRWSNPFQRPDAPWMTGVAVRGSQERERARWVADIESVWRDWRRGKRLFPASAPNGLGGRLRARYDEEVACCLRCDERATVRWWHGSSRPEHCYGRMADSTGPVWSWAKDQLLRHARRVESEVDVKLQACANRLRVAQRHLRERVHEQDQAAASLGALHDQHARLDAEDDRLVTIARTVYRVLNEKNKAAVEDSVARAARTRGDTRAELFLAGLRDLHDLERTFAR